MPLHMLQIFTPQNQEQDANFRAIVAAHRKFDAGNGLGRTDCKNVRRQAL